MGKYNYEVDENNENSVYSIVLNNIERNLDILECGCATGYFTKALVQKLDSRVSVIEYNSNDIEKAKKYAHDALLANLEDANCFKYFKNKKFDCILFLDVLEHLNNPKEVLRRSIKLLKRSGKVIISVPNISHFDIIYNQLNNNWKYTQLGLLDNTHIYHFGENNIEDLFNNCNLTITRKEYTIAPPFSTEQNIQLKEDDDKFIVDYLCNKQYSDVYQYVYIGQKSEYVKENKIKCIDNYLERRTKFGTLPDTIIEYEKKLLNFDQSSAYSCYEYTKKIENEYNTMLFNYNSIKNSFFWKISCPIRKCLDYIKLICSNLK